MRKTDLDFLLVYMFDATQSIDGDAKTYLTTHIIREVLTYAEVATTS